MEEAREQNLLETVWKVKLNQNSYDAIARRNMLEYGYDFWDNPEGVGYRGYKYDGRWQSGARKLAKFFELTAKAKILDVGCGKGFLVYDLAQVNAGFQVKGLDYSAYAIENAKPEIRSNLIQGSAAELPFEDKSFDLVVSINTLQALPLDTCTRGFQELERVGKQSFVQIVSYRNEHERANLVKFDPTVTVVKSTDEWIKYFREIGYTGYYYWVIFL